MGLARRSFSEIAFIFEKRREQPPDNLAPLGPRARVWKVCWEMSGQAESRALSMMARARTRKHTEGIPPLGPIDLMTAAGGLNRWRTVKGAL